MKIGKQKIVDKLKFLQVSTMKLPSSTSADTKVISAELTYWGTVYEPVKWKLNIIPTSTIIWDARRICLQNINHI